MRLWSELARCLLALRPACSRLVSFCWLCVVIVGFCCRRDLAGVTSFIRAAWMKPSKYRRLLHLFHSNAVKLPQLVQVWLSLVLTLFEPLIIAGRLVCIADGLLVPKEGHKMPAVKSLHSDSQNNSKPTFFMGHSFQAVSLLVKTGSHLLSIPLFARIQEGLVWPDQAKSSLPSKLAALIHSVWRERSEKILLIVDAYFANRNCIEPLLKAEHHVVTRVRSTAVGYRSPVPSHSTRRGRAKVYGDRVQLREIFDSPDLFTSAQLRLYSNTTTVAYHQIDLLWKPLRRVVRFVLVVYPNHPNLILLSTDITLSAEQIITLYSYRFKIESGFKHAKHSLGTYGYHFWMAKMHPISKGSSDQILLARSPQYLSAIERKINAYHLFVQIGCIAQGLLLHLSANLTHDVWATFCGWIRTIRPGALPSEAVVAESLRWTFPEILRLKPQTHLPFKFLQEELDYSRFPEWIKIPA